MRRIPTGAAVVLVAVAVVLPAASVLARPASAQTAARLDLEAQTLFVDDAPAEIVVRVSGAPDNASLRFTIYDRPAVTRAEVRAQHRDPPTRGTRVANFECTLDGDCRGQAAMAEGPDGIRTITLNDDVIGESLRNSRGALPFVVRLLDDGGNDLDSFVTSLVVLDDVAPQATGPYRVRVAFTGQLRAPVARQADLRSKLDANALLNAAAPLAAHPNLPVSTDIRPETLDALAALDPVALNELLDIIDGRPFVRGPWVNMDEEAWRVVGESDQVISQYAIGDDAIERLTGEQPTGLTPLDLDAAPATLTLLRSAGATAVLVDDAQLDDRTKGTPPTQPLQLLDTNGVAITALRYDEALHETLDDDDPELAAYRALAELAVLADEATTDQGVLLAIDRIDQEVLARLLEGIDTRRSLQITDVDDLTAHELTRLSGETLRGTLVPSPAPDVDSLAAELESTTQDLARVARMFLPDTQLIRPFVTQLQVAVSSDLRVDTASRYVVRVDRAIRELTSGIEIPSGDRITLTDRRTDLPLTIVNRQAVPVQIELLLSAEKVRFPEGDRVELTLEPGENVVTVPVETLASGDARITANIVSPGGFRRLSAGTIDVRSTAISGLGLVISLVALAVLAGWWIRTILRVRRNRSAATVSAEPPADADLPDTAPTEGET